MSRAKHLQIFVFFAFVSGFVTGCFGNSSTPFIVEGEVLEPLRDSRASWPDNDEGWVFKKGSNDDSPGWCDANGFINAPLDEVWQALMHEDVVVERARVDEWSKVGSCDAEPFEECFDFFTHMSVMGVDIDTIVTWRYDVQTWDGDTPLSMVVRYQKSWGSDVIDRNTGSLTLEAIDEQTTRVEYVGEIETWGSDDSDAMESYARSLVADLEAFVEGRPLP